MTIQVYPEPTAGGTDVAAGLIPANTYGDVVNSSPNQGNNVTNTVIAELSGVNLPAGVYDFGTFNTSSATGSLNIGTAGTGSVTSQTGVFVSTAGGTFKVKVQSKWDGISNGPLTATGRLSSVDYANGYLIVSGAKFVSTAEVPYIWISTEGESFTEVEVMTGLGGNNLIYNVLYDGTYYIGGHSADGFVISTNLTTWTTRSGIAANKPSIGRYEPDSSYYKYVFAGETTYVHVSTNGTTWTSKTHGIGNAPQNIRFLNNNWFAFGSSAKISLSTDGANTWNLLSPNPLDGTDTIQDMAYGNGAYVAVSIFGNIIASTDGINWSSAHNSNNTTWRTSINAGNQLGSIIFTDGYFMTAGNANIQGLGKSATGFYFDSISTSAVTAGVSAGVVTSVSVPNSAGYPNNQGKFWHLYGRYNNANYGEASNWRINGSLVWRSAARYSATMSGRAVGTFGGNIVKKADLSTLTYTTT